jgi:hypothetical protein
MRRLKLAALPLLVAAFEFLGAAAAQGYFRTK